MMDAAAHPTAANNLAAFNRSGFAGLKHGGAAWAATPTQY